MNSMVHDMSEELFIHAGKEFLKNAHGRAEDTLQRMFHALFGVLPTICANIWGWISSGVPAGISARHIL